MIYSSQCPALIIVELKYLIFWKCFIIFRSIIGIFHYLRLAASLHQISGAGVITHRPDGQFSQVLLTIFATLISFLSAGRKQIAYQHSSVIHYLTHIRLLFLHWAVKRQGPAVAGVEVLSGVGSVRKTPRTEPWMTVIKTDLRETFQHTRRTNPLKL